MFSRLWCAILIFAVLIKHGGCGYFEPCDTDSDCGPATNNVACFQGYCNCPGGAQPFFHRDENYTISFDNYVCQKQCYGDSDCNLENHETCFGYDESTQTSGLCSCQMPYFSIGTPKCVEMLDYSNFCPDNTFFNWFCDKDFGMPCYNMLGPDPAACTDAGVCCVENGTK